MTDIACQILLTLLCGGAIALISLGGRWPKYGFMLGLASEVFWFRLAIMHGQVDVFLLSVWYTLCFGFGLWRSFRKGKK